jgi:uncharacterized repeat protein (TIGR03803 family)
VLYTFNEDAIPFSPLVQATDGNLYGTTKVGGAHGAGQIYRLTPDGNFTDIYDFCSQPGCADGELPIAGLVQASDGYLYGLSFQGGISRTKCNPEGSCGTIFRIGVDGSFTTLYQFCNQDTCTDGFSPVGTLVQASDGNLYGATSYGGLQDACFPHGCGTVFRITPAGSFTTMHSFNYADGSFLNSGLIQARDGNLYGTASSGGKNNAGNIFMIGLDGSFNVVHTFCHHKDGDLCVDGASPIAALTEGTNGDLYGTTSRGGSAPFGACDMGCGTIFRLALDGTFLVLHLFDFTDGALPGTGLIQASDGNFYGTVASGGNSSNTGVSYRITPQGAFSVQHTVCMLQNCKDGTNPIAEMYQDTNGVLYGTALLGSRGGGVVFALLLGLQPIVKTLPNFGPVGTPITILGSSLSGAVSVTFNGVPATFTLVSGTEITTTVPAGASTGPVQVNSSTGTVRSSGPFHVTP